MKDNKKTSHSDVAIEEQQKAFYTVQEDDFKKLARSFGHPDNGFEGFKRTHCHIGNPSISVIFAIDVPYSYVKDIKNIINDFIFKQNIDDEYKITIGTCTMYGEIEAEVCIEFTNIEVEGTPLTKWLAEQNNDYINWSKDGEGALVGYMLVPSEFLPADTTLYMADIFLNRPREIKVERVEQLTEAMGIHTDKSLEEPYTIIWFKKHFAGNWQLVNVDETDNL